MTTSKSGVARFEGAAEATPVLEIAELTIELSSGGREVSEVEVVSNVSLQVHEGRTVGLVGESGCGKSMTARAVLGVLPLTARVVGGDIRLRGTDVLDLPSSELERVRGKRIAMIFQDAMRSLNPAFTVGYQIAEVARKHIGLTRRQAWDRAVEMLDRVAIVEPGRRAHSYPGELSGGMAQRVMIAMALAAEPEVLIADEPTTALDVTVQAEVLRLLRSLQDEMGLGLLFVTHDLGVVAEMCDEVSVMYAGHIVEQASVVELFDRPQHPYTAALLGSLPTVHQRTEPFGFIPGIVPPPQSWPSGCRFSPRCAYATDACRSAPIELVTLGDEHRVRCVRVGELSLEGAWSK